MQRRFLISAAIGFFVFIQSGLASGQYAFGAFVRSDMTLTKPIRSSPAAKARLRNEDKLLSFDGRPMKNLNSVLNFLLTSSEGQKVQVQIYRQGRMISKSVKLAKAFDMHRLKLYELLMLGRKINILVVAGEFSNTMLEMEGHPETKSAWQEAAATKQIKLEEESLMSYFGKLINFSLADRSIILDVLEDLRGGDISSISPEVREQIRQLTNASHILYISGSQIPHKKRRCLDTVSFRLIDLQTGSTISHVETKTVKSPDGKIKKNIYEVN